MDTRNTDENSRKSPGVLSSGTTSTSNNNNNFFNGPSYALNGKIMLGTVIFLFLAIAAIIGLHSYARWLFLNRRRRRRRIPLQHAATALSKGGLEVSVLKSIPTLTFYAAAGNSPNNLGDCAVCLSEFEDGETGRALPKCGHAFHVECIDMWFQTHSNCPLCRAPVQAFSGESLLQINTAVLSPSQNLENHNSGSENSRVELVGISVEAPQPSMEERFRVSPEDLSSGSYGTDAAKPVLSMKRIWSV
ncbi:hypothetical protein SAY87_027828 [Trapa incisa]|uniref:RING-type E3 ubiquitin transferase n=1 Tax=Trapa incisa TaxID=236973 RepID=A0AAN7PKX7_9MYRT|nr:hypothetical protein SAY87_027828 [Trapa incisa]